MSSEEIPAGGETKTEAQPRTEAQAEAASQAPSKTQTQARESTENPQTLLDLKDPKAMRALAHPVRLALVELLEVAGTLTATQASDLLGESPANCAFHLRTLAKYGFVAEAGGGKGRERPWKCVNMKIHLSTYHEDAATTVTARTLHELWLDRVLERAKQQLTGDDLPEEWRGAEEAAQTVTFLTADETRQLSEDILQLMNRYKERHGDVSKRPPGALPVEMLFFAYPLTRMARLAASEAEE